MSAHWKDIAELLRNELADYGELLGLYDEQQRGLFSRQPDTVLHLSSAIQNQVCRVAESRDRRRAAVSDFAVERGRPANSKLRDLFPAIEPDARPLIEALIGEINLLLHRVIRTHRQNHTLLNRAIAIHRETLQLLRPDSFTRTYSQSGVMSVSADRSSSTLRVAG